MKSSIPRRGSLLFGHWFRNQHSKSRGSRRLGEQGATFIELAMAVTMMGALVSAVLLARSFTAKMTQKNADKAYATQKALQMMEELRAVAASAGVSSLDNYSDGSKFNDELTTQAVTLANASSSGNIAAGPGWKYWRQVEVTNLPNDPFARLITVSVYQGDQLNPANAGVLLAQTGGVLRSSTTVTPPTQVLDVYGIAISNTVGWFTEMPQMSSAFSSAVSDMESRNPGLDVRSHFITQSGFGRDILYTPFINGFSSGNDTTDYAMPFIYFYPGWTKDTSGTGTTGNPDIFFSESQLNQDGNIQDDSGASPLATSYPVSWGYAVCDLYNHDMRYPDELAMYQSVSQYAVNNNITPPEMTLRMLLEGMNSEPASFENAIIVSMHGEVLPLIALRNWSDPAKDPGLTVPGSVNGSGSSAVTWPSTLSSTNMRAVAHPTLIHFPSGASVTLRAYAFYDGLDWQTSGPVTTGAVTTANGAGGAVTTIDLAYPATVNNRIPVMTVYIKGGGSVTQLTAGTGSGQISVSCIYGGINGTAGANTIAYGIAALNASTAGTSIGDPGGMGMSWAMGPVTTGSECCGTTLTFYNTPLRAPEVPTSPVTAGRDRGGLPVTNQLYESEYIPCDVGNTSSPASLFFPDLTSTTPGPKNTARWVIIVHSNPVSALYLSDGQYTVETRLGSDLTSGTQVSSSGQTAAPNLSRTYVWMGGGAVSAIGTASCGITPWTERYQYIGDARDCPYADVKYGSLAVTTTDSYVTIAPYGYNRYFKYLSGNPTDGYYFGVTDSYGVSTTSDGYDGYSDRRDMPKYYYLYRNGLLNQQGIFCNLNGYTCWHADMGGEIGGTYDPFAGSISFIATPWQPSGGAAVTNHIDEIQTTNDFQTDNKSSARDIVRAATGSNSFTLGQQWYGRFWRGELYPDDYFSQGTTNWLNTGNLPTGNGQFFRCLYGNVGVSAGNSTDGFVWHENYQWGVGGNAPAAFINGVSGGTTYLGFMHTTGIPSTGSYASLTSLGSNLYNTTAFPLNSPVSYARPWSWTFNLNNSNKPADWATSAPLRVALSNPSNASPYGGSQLSRIFYDPDNTISASGPSNPDSNWHAVGVVEMEYPSTGSATQSAFYLASGLAPQGNFGAYELAETDLSAMVRTFMDGGLYTGVSHIVQLPLFQVSTGNPANQFANPSAVTLSWASPVTAQSTSLWWRWAGSLNSVNFYTEEYPGYSTPATYSLNSYSNDNGVTLLYVPMYSNNDGKSWLYLDNSSAVTGVYPASAGTSWSMAAYNHSVTTTSTNWNLSNTTTFPQGDYIARVEGYRKGYPLHFSFHQLQINISR